MGQDFLLVQICLILKTFTNDIPAERKTCKETHCSSGSVGETLCGIKLHSKGSRMYQMPTGVNLNSAWLT